MKKIRKYIVCNKKKSTTESVRITDNKAGTPLTESSEKSLVPTTVLQINILKRNENPKTYFSSLETKLIFNVLPYDRAYCLCMPKS